MNELSFSLYDICFYHFVFFHCHYSMFYHIFFHKKTTPLSEVIFSLF
ncbi:hypothetical protein HMPREF3191_01348 [Veillonellaceae bacterium DNF00626]|nr:hypothetical protein HMPREF3191_01348 [Veillonellaceae bacterium DNF00626]